MRIYPDITATIGHTPLVRLTRLAAGASATIVAKSESFNPLSCVKEHIALAMVDAAQAEGLVTAGTTLIEPTSGNTGVGLACVCAARGLHLVLVMPEDVSQERQQIVTALGAELLLTPASQGMAGAIRQAEQLHAEIADSFVPIQLANPANPRAHQSTTAIDIWDDTDGQVDIVVDAAGTGGTVTGLARGLKPLKPSLRVVAVEPAESPALSGGAPGPRGIPGIGRGFIPQVLDLTIIAQIMPVSTADAKRTARRLARAEGILAGISSGAAMFCRAPARR
jgi:cysteine synthase A